MSKICNIYSGGVFLLLLPLDRDEKIQQYANPNRLVSTSWLAQNMGSENLVVLESNEDVLLYDTGHIAGAMKIDWHTDLNDAFMRDYVTGEEFSKLCSKKGISRDSTVVIYGDNNNWWAAYALWVFTLFGHEDIRLLDGGRSKWLAENRPMTKDKPVVKSTSYPVVEREDEKIRCYKEDVLAHFGKPIIDVRSWEEYTGKLMHMPNYPNEGTLRGGHIPTALTVPWGRAAAEDGTFKSVAELKTIYTETLNLSKRDEIVVYCRIGERSSHTWFVLNYLLGYESVKNYDGSWTEWGNAVKVPIAVGESPGFIPEK